MKQSLAAYIQFQSNIISCDGTLTWYLDGNLLQTLYILDLVEKRDEYCQARLQNSVELSHSFHNPGLLLRNKSVSVLATFCWY